MALEAGDASSIKKLGWRQGSILPHDLVERLQAENLLPSGQECDFVVISHDCDVTHAAQEAEPWVEVLKVRLVSLAERNAHLEWGKNPRKYQFRVARGNADVYCEISIHDVIRFDRLRLRDHVPDADRKLPSETIRQLALWYARRYSRQAFPDEFNERIRQAGRKLHNKFKGANNVIRGIYFLLSPDTELAESESYDLIVWVTMSTQTYEVPDSRSQAQKLVDLLETELRKCKGITVQGVELRSEGDVSLDDLRQLKRWDFDDLTLRGEGVAMLPADS